MCLRERVIPPSDLHVGLIGMSRLLLIRAVYLSLIQTHNLYSYSHSPPLLSKQTSPMVSFFNLLFLSHTLYVSLVRSFNNSLIWVISYNPHPPLIISSKNFLNITFSFRPAFPTDDALLWTFPGLQTDLLYFTSASLLLQQHLQYMHTLPFLSLKCQSLCSFHLSTTGLRKAHSSSRQHMWMGIMVC